MSLSLSTRCDSNLLQVLVPPLREMEAYVFEQMVRLLWRTLVEVSVWA